LKSGIKIIHWIIFLWVCLLILQYELIVSYISLTFDFILLIINDFLSALSIMNFGFADASIATILFILLLPIMLTIKKRLRFLQAKLNFSFAFLAIICFVFLFAPIITNENPEFSKNLAVTKLLPPLSSLSEIQLKKSEENNLSLADIFRIKSEQVLEQQFDDNIILADSVFLGDPLIYFQKSRRIEIEKSSLISEAGIPLIKNKFYLLGTDEFGRDLFSRLIYGTRISITVGLGAVIVAFFIGIIFGFIAGYRGGFIDISLNRFTEMFLAFPVIYLVILILTLFGSSIFSVIIVLGVSGWMSLFKIVKSEVLSIKQKDYFSTAELVGLSKLQLLRKEILPVMLTPVLVNLIFLFSNVVLAEAALSYLGLGTGNSYPSWGSMINSGQEYITKAWWLIAFPGVALVFTLFAFNSSGRTLGKKFNPLLRK
jgi:peptide/nickel transport system permease protein